MTQEELIKMEIHQEVKLHSSACDQLIVTRVYQGWIYTFVSWDYSFHVDQNGMQYNNSNRRMSNVFVAEGLNAI